MRKSLVTRCCKAIGIAAALLYAAAVQDPARAGLFEDANVLVRGGDIDAIEQTFENQYQAFLRHEIDLSDQVRPYAAFYTLDPVVVEMVPAWRAAYPDSVHARVAQANLNQHLAVVLRGDEYNHMVPRRALDQARELWSEARSLGAEALDSAPSHAAAADALSASANWLGDNVAEQRGNKVLEAFASPRGTLLDQIADSLPQWGGSVAMMRHLCDARAPQVENLSVEECQARVTLLLSDTPAPERAAAVEVLRRENFELNRFFIARQLLKLGRAQEALDLYDEVGAWISGRLADDFGKALNNPAIQERIIDRWLTINPLHPRHLAQKAEVHLARRDIAAATASTDKAMVYGEFIPEVRLMRLRVMADDTARRSMVLGEIEDALTDTDFYPSIVEFAISRLVWHSDAEQYLPDPEEALSNQCRVGRVLAYANYGCQRHWKPAATLGCSVSSMQQVQQILGQTDFDRCEGMQPLHGPGLE